MNIETNNMEPLLNQNDKEIGIDKEEADIENKIRKEMRHGFIVKTYGILLFQLAITTFCIFLSHNSKTYIGLLHSTVLFWISIIGALTIAILPLCSLKLFRTVPINYILLILFTLFESHLVAAVTAAYDANTVLLALGATAGVVISLTIYAFVTEKDFTICGGLLFSMLGTLIIICLINLFLQVAFIRVIITYCSLLLFSIYLIYDTQLIIGGKRFQFEVDDYILASFNLYLDIINIFLDILRILQR